MVSKDQSIGALICLVCVVVAIAYVVLLFYPPATAVLVNWLRPLGIGGDNYKIRLWLVALPVAVAFIAVLAIGAWIGWTMATTPPPRPIEEIEAEEMMGEGQPEPAGKT